MQLIKRELLSTNHGYKNLLKERDRFVKPKCLMRKSRNEATVDLRYNGLLKLRRENGCLIINARLFPTG